MVPGSSLIDADTVEREIITRLRAAKLRLRFDKAALRVVGRLKIALAGVVPEGETVVYHNPRPDKASCEDGCCAGKHAARRPDRRGAR